MVRDLLIISIVVLGIVLHLILHFNNSYILVSLHEVFNGLTYYEINYISGFLKSFIVLLFCVKAAEITLSKRLKYGLSSFLIISMVLDLSSIFSPEFYWMIKPFRYDNYINFSNLYTTFEVSCVLFTFTKFILHFIKTIISQHTASTTGIFL